MVALHKGIPRLGLSSDMRKGTLNPGFAASLCQS